jgi:hypothetical protein
VVSLCWLRGGGVAADHFAVLCRLRGVLWIRILKRRQGACCAGELDAVRRMLMKLRSSGLGAIVWSEGWSKLGGVVEDGRGIGTGPVVVGLLMLDSMHAALLRSI